MWIFQYQLSEFDELELKKASNNHVHVDTAYQRGNEKLSS